MLLFAFLACTSPTPQIEADHASLKVHAFEDINSVEIWQEKQPLFRQQIPQAIQHVQIPFQWSEGKYTIIVNDHQQSLFIPPLPKALFWMEAPIGQGKIEITEDSIFEFPRIDERPIEAAIRILPLQNGLLTISGEVLHVQESIRKGDEQFYTFPVDGSAQIKLSFADLQHDIVLQPTTVLTKDLRQHIEITDAYFPCDSYGEPDISKNPDQITLPDPWMDVLKEKLGIGLRPSDPEIPWGYSSISLANSSSRDTNLIIQSRMIDKKGQPSVIFAPQIRDGRDPNGWVSSLLRLPADSTAEAVLPLYLNEQLLREDGDYKYQQEFLIYPLGSTVPIKQMTKDIHVSSRSGFALWGFLISILSTALGFCLLLGRWRSWISTLSNAQLVTIASFATMLFIASGMSQLLGMSISFALGPFATLVTSAIEHLFRYALLISLLMLIPRSGVVSIFLLVSALLSGFLVGSFDPLSISFVCSNIFWSESLLYIMGITRSDRWREYSTPHQFMLLGAALSLSGVFYGATGMALHISLYRLYYADWYIAMMLLGPGFLYIWIAVGMAIPFAKSLRGLAS